MMRNDEGVFEHSLSSLTPSITIFAKIPRQNLTKPLPN